MRRQRQTFRKPFKAVPIRPGGAYLRRHKRNSLARSLWMAGSIFLATLVVGLILTNWSTVGNAIGLSDRDNPRFAVCGLVRRTCVIDGDTFWLEGEKIRIADIDTPEISEPRCDWEYARGIEARDRLVALLNEGSFELSPIGGRDEDQYGRKLRIVVRDGYSLGDQLVSEGLARTWTGRREPWC
jgi:micrococcal nuclease